jgi:hypothetical protein
MTGRAAQKLLEDMRASQSGWGQNDFSRLLLGSGFQKREGGKHTIYHHPVHPDLRISVPRHDKLREWVARDAIKLLDELNHRNTKEETEDERPEEGSSIL